MSRQTNSTFLKSGIKQLREDSIRMNRNDSTYVNAIGNLIERKGSSVHVTDGGTNHRGRSILMMAQHESGIYYGYGTTIEPHIIDQTRFPGRGYKLN